MSAANFDRCLALVLMHEGGYVDHPADPGGATNLGVTIGALSEWLGRKATKSEVRALTKASVAPIYRKRYWDAVCGDDLPAGVDFATFDFAVNSGRARGAMSLQRAVGVADDGHPGAVTLAAALAEPADQTVERICADRLAFLKRLSTWRTFGRGWAKRVEGVRAEALTMAGRPPAKPAPAKPATRARTAARPPMAKKARRLA